MVNTVDIQELMRLINDVQVKADECDLSDEEKETVENSLEVIEQEAKAEKPRKSFIKTAITGLKAIKGTAELAAAVVTLFQFLQPLL